MQRVFCTIVSAVLAAACFGAAAQEKPYPAKPIRFIVPFAPGGGADIVARLIGARMTEGMGVQIVVDNRAGASSTVGDTLGARASPDGYTINLVTTSNVATLPHVKSGRLRALAVTTAQRSSAVPELPTIAEAGVTGFEAVHWFAVLGPSGLNREIVSRLNAELKRVIALPDVEPRMQQAGLIPAHTAPEVLREKIRTEVAKFGRVVKEANIRPE